MTEMCLAHLITLIDRCSTYSSFDRPPHHCPALFAISTTRPLAISNVGLTTVVYLCHHVQAVCTHLDFSITTLYAQSLRMSSCAASRSSCNACSSACTITLVFDSISSMPAKTCQTSKLLSQHGRSSLSSQHCSGVVCSSTEVCKQTTETWLASVGRIASGAEIGVLSHKARAKRLNIRAVADPFVFEGQINVEEHGRVQSIVEMNGRATAS
jgi:hypothetical protein